MSDTGLIIDVAQERGYHLSREAQPQLNICLRNAGSVGGPFTLGFEHQIDTLRMEAIECGTLLIQTGLNCGTVTLEGHSQRISIESNARVSARKLILRGGDFVFSGTLDNLRELQLVNAKFTAVHPIPVMLLGLTGKVGLASEVQADACRISGRAWLQCGANVHLGITSTPGDTEVQVEGGVANCASLAWISPGCAFVLDGSSIQLGPVPVAKPRVVDADTWQAATEDLRDIAFSGSGIVRLRRHASRLEFHGRHLTLDAVEVQLSEIQGSIGALAARRSLIQGGRGSKAVSLHTVREAVGCEIEAVDVFPLQDEGSIERLAEARRLTPWIPPSVELWKCQRHQVGDTRSKRRPSDWRRNARFWASLLEVLEAKAAPGSTLSSVRLCLMRANARGLDRKADHRGWLLYRLYGAIGYGERILLPLFDWVAIAATLALPLWAWHLTRPREPYWQTLFGVFAAPLSIFRVSTSYVNTPGVWGNIVFGAAQVLGIALVGTAVLALRRNIGSSK